jgi:carboxymethylenebutenolidase
MASMAENVEITTLVGRQRFSAYMAKPEGRPRAAIIVIQEVFGVNEGIRRKCDGWAQQGYLAIAPDLFWRMKPGLELDPDVPEQMQEALGYFSRYNPDEGVADIEATIQWVRQQHGIDQVGCVGFCLGGKLAYMTATRTDVSASVGYYPVGIDQMLNECHAIAHPLLMHFASADGFVSAEQQQRIHAALDTHPKITIYDYEGLDHGFAAEMGQRRDEQGAKLADRRTCEFFAEHLG